MWILTIVLGVVVVLLITAVTGYFVAQEFAYMAVDRSRLAARAAAGDAASSRALDITRRTSFMLSGAQLGITVTGLLVGYVAEPLIGESIEIGLGTTVPPGTGLVVGTVVALLFSTLVQMLFGELFPKNLAIAKPEPVARWLARSTGIYLMVFGWLIKIFDHASTLLLRLARIEPVHDVEHAATRDDLEHIVAESATVGALPEELSVLIDRIIDFPERDVAHAMVPLSRTDAVHSGDRIAQVRAQMVEGHSRYPVVDADRDVVGTVELLDLLAQPTSGDDRPVSAVMRPGVLVPTSMRLPDALGRMADAGSKLVCVIDEYGGLAGIVTAEDLAEEIVGEIVDEHDPTPEDALAARTEDGSWVIQGELPLDEVERHLGHDLPEGDHETLAGLVIAAFGSLPTVGDRVEVPLPINSAEFADADEPVKRLLVAEVLEVERHVPSAIRATVVTAPDPDPDPDLSGKDVSRETGSEAGHA